MKTDKKIEVYEELTRQRFIALFSFLIACTFTFIIDISVGPSFLSIYDVFSAIFSPNSCDHTTRIIVWSIRLPIALMAIVVGAALGLAGALMQTILNNPLASPYTLGVSAGAGFGAALAIVLGVGVIPWAEEYLVPINAFFFAMIATLLVFFISKTKGVTTETMILTGIAVMFLFNSLLALLEYIASEQALQAIVFWLFGSLLKTTWTKLGITSLVLLLITLLLTIDVWKLTALRMGDEIAKSLGVDVKKLRLKVFIYISLLTAVAVCFVGTIGFIGLVAPHIARILVGEDQRFLIPMSLLAGAFLLSTSSIISKLIIPGSIFPIGIVTSFIGVPFFLYLILRKRKRYW